jgi:hypothetical protein
MDEFSSQNQASSYTGQYKDRNKYPTIKPREELKLMIAALDSMHFDRPGVRKGTESGKHVYSDPKTQIYARFRCYIFIFGEKIGRKITHYQL